MQTSISENESQIAEYLLKIKAVRLSINQPFTWSSGWKSPIYCDNRLILSYPTVRQAVKMAFVEKIRERFPEAGAIAGVATGGIALGALVADEMGLPFIYVRPTPKSHGLQNQIEGMVKPELPYVVVEDLISTGSSSAAAVVAVQETGATVLGTIAIFGYGFAEAHKTFGRTGTPFDTLTHLGALLSKATDMKYIREEEMATIFQWKDHPESWPIQ